MGVPKFFRYISERYPCLSELVKEHQIPEFDNLYLDMNGIIHMCSHPDDYDPHFRISEEKMFSDIFHYIEVLFRMIKPQKLFFMAVDGVAPRAKMNQQRGRRFRSAKEAEVLEAKAKERGEELPAEARFDSNCITPGTFFMARLHEQLKYFVSNKISSDKLWQKCKIILSGHETPGEGEHKIMDYIRYMKAQPGYDPNTRHCLYGLDADLIMLGLCTHEPHFSLLREEVRFGKKSKRKNIPEQITFFLLHLSLMREYLELEFLPLKDTLPFEYDMEKIIDDWVLMGFLVGNDFIPHLPNLHIASGALPVLYNVYMKILPTLDGYINEAGQLNLDRFEKFMSTLGSLDMDHFNEQYADLKYFHTKTGRNPNTKERHSYKPRQLEVWLPNDCDNEVADDKAETKTTNKELEALIKSTDDMLLNDFLKNDTTDDATTTNKELEALIKSTDEMLLDSFLKNDITADATTEIKLLSNPELFVTAKVDDLLTELVTETASTATADSNLHVDIFGSGDKTSEEPVCDEEKIKTENLVLLEPSESNLADLALDDIELHDDEDATSPYYSESDTEDDDLMNAEFIQHKNDYYMNKLDYSKVTPEVMRDQAEGYVRAIQWNLHYYYNGVCSWSWYYPHHYAPYISDIKGFADLKLEYELGTPFRPFEQLLAVLPAASKTLLPEPYQELMTAEESPIIDFYPQEFRTDLNGKKQEWEAVVLIPFIDEIALLKAMATCNERLNEEARKRNSHGPMLVYEYTEDDLGNYTAPEYYPTIEINNAKLTPVTIEEIRVPIENLVKGPCPGSIHDIYYPGFPTLKHLKYTGHLEKAKVKVFDTPSQNENMIVKIEPHEKNLDIEELARKLLGTSVHVSWPHLVEAQVVSLSDEGCRYHKIGVPGKFNLEFNKGNLNQLWHSQKAGITIYCKEKLGIDVGDTTILAHVKIVTGKKYVSSSNGQVLLQKQWANVESCFPLQAVVQNLAVYEVDNKKIETIQDLFPMGSKCFMTGHPHYGSIGEVIDNVSLKSGRIKVSMSVLPEPDLFAISEFAEKVKYVSGGPAAQRLSITPHLLSRITGSIFAIPGVKGNSYPKNSSKMNIGLNLKLNKKNEEIPGYTRKVDGQWLYSYNAVLLVRSYMEFCPDLFVYITSHLGNDVFYESELFPENIGEGKIQKIVDWIKKQPFSSIDRQKVGSQTVDVEVVKKIEETIDDYHSLNPKPKQVVMQVKPHLLYKPEIQTGHLPPDSSAQYQLYDRVVNVRESYTVPFGCKGTIIGIQGTSVLGNNGEDDLEIMYDVLFDQSFPGGLQLNCSPNRGYRVPKTALINITHGMRVVQQKTVNPATNNPWYGNVPMKQNQQQQPVQSQNSAFASWTPSNQNQNNYYRQQQPQHQQQQRMFQPPQHQQQQRMFQPPHRGMHPPPPFGHLMNHHHRMPAPATQQPTSGPRPANNSGVSAEFHAFLQDLQKNQGKGKHRNPNSAPAQMRTPTLLQSGQSQVSQTRNSSSSSNSSAQPATVPSVDPAESLKKLLNISGKPPSADQPSTSSVNNNVSQPISVEDFFAHARTKEQKLAESSNQSSNNPYYSVQLLNYCQAQRIGIPRYNYLPSTNNKVRAQISLPDGRMVIGDESASKEEATENAAKIIITDMLQMNTDPPARHPHHRPTHAYSGPGPKGFPVPPKQWCQQTQKLQRSHKQSPKQNQTINFTKQQQINGSQVQIPIRKEAVKTEDIKSPGSTSFVPLQAVKQQRNKSTINVGETNDSKRKEQGAMGGNSPNKNATKIKSGNSPVKNSNPQTQSSSNSPPKQRARRSRIAANFSGLQQPKQ